MNATALDHLRQVPLFSQLTDEDLTEFSGNSHSVHFAAGKTLAQEGAAADCAYLIVEGEVSIWRSGFRISANGPGTCIGELGFLNESARTATVRAETEVKAILIRYSELNALLSRPTFGKALLRAMATKVTEAAERQAETSRSSEVFSAALSRYVSEDMVDLILSRDPKDVFRSQSTTATIMFADLRNFSALAESSTPEDLIELLRGYMDKMMDVVLRRGGYINEIMGDGLLVAFGLPMDHPSPDVSAVSTALEMLQTLAGLNRVRERNRRITLRMGIGINAGPVVAGNIGDERRMKYCIIGDTINLASRLEGLTKFYDLPIVISETVADQLGSRFLLRQLDQVRVKGRNTPCRIYEPLAPTHEATAAQQDLAETYHRAFTAYSERRWTEARQLLEVSPVCKHDGPSARLMTRCAAYEQHPPSESWDATFDLEFK